VNAVPIIDVPAGDHSASKGKDGEVERENERRNETTKRIDEAVRERLSLVIGLVEQACWGYLHPWGFG